MLGRRRRPDKSIKGENEDERARKNMDLRLMGRDWKSKVQQRRWKVATCGYRGGNQPPLLEVPRAASSWLFIRRACRGLYENLVPERFTLSWTALSAARWILHGVYSSRGIYEGARGVEVTQSFYLR